MRLPNSTRLVAIATLVAATLLASALPAHAHDREDEKLPAPPVRMRVIAPSAVGPWMLRIDNESDAKIRIPADVRLLTFEVRTPSDAPVRQTHASGWSRRATVCDGPRAFGLTGRFPARRELVLEPGHSYTEEFDPRLICFGKDAELLVPGARVKAYLGWKPRPRWSKQMDAAPFAVDAASVPRKYRPMRRLEAPTLVLSHAPPVVYGPDGETPQPTVTPSDRAPTAPAGAGTEGDGSKGAGTKNAGRAPGAPSQPPDSGPRPRQAPPGGEAHHHPQGGDHPHGARKKGPKSAEEASMHRPRRRPTSPRPDPPAQDLSLIHISEPTRPY